LGPPIFINSPECASSPLDSSTNHPFPHAICFVSNISSGFSLPKFIFF
jgi:hypothetical protein